MSQIETVAATRQVLDQCKRVVVKVGSSLLTGPDNGLEVAKIDAYATQIAQLAAAGHQVTLVSSGAVAAGCLREKYIERGGPDGGNGGDGGGVFFGGGGPLLFFWFSPPPFFIF